MNSAALRVHRIHVDSTAGVGRTMACRPVGLCPPERMNRGWSANRGARLTRVSANRLQGPGGTADVPARGTSSLATTPHAGRVDGVAV
jgi:hypothetical protein